MKTELLAPAKDKEIAFAAINCGADAVYIGAGSYGARHNACNSLDDIKEVVDYAHRFWAKVYVTVNTILTDEELKNAVQLVIDLDKIGVDAVLVQDMGLLNEIIKLQNSNSVNIPIHMSTQCDNRDAEKISFFSKIGVSRVVLARELSIEQIKNIHKANPNIELEGFIHGALCVSYSGQCYLSQYIGGRSANRGECAQPCRKNYSIITDSGEYLAKNIPALCLKDFNASEHIHELIDAGICSFKIEGRLKDEGYVKNIVSYYRQELDKYSQKTSSGKSMIEFTPNPAKSFNRGFTDYFLKGRSNCYNLISPKSRGEYIGTVTTASKNTINIKTSMLIHHQDGLCFETTDGLEGFLVNTASKISDNLYLITTNRNLELKPGTKIYRNVDTEFEKELLKPVKRQIGVYISFKNNVLTLTDEDNISIQIPINEGEKANNPDKIQETFIKQFSKTGESDFYIKEIKIESELPFMPISIVNKLRRDSFEMLMNKRLNEYKRPLPKTITYADYYKSECDYRANVHNKSAEEFYNKCNCKITEWSLERALPNHKTELMRTKHCIRYAFGMCTKISHTPHKVLFLVDEKGVKYPLEFDCKNCEMVILRP